MSISQTGNVRRPVNRIFATILRASQPKPPQPVVSLQSFAAEVIDDLPDLLVEHPNGVSTTTLIDWYGETYARVTRVIKQLESSGLIRTIETISGAINIVPIDYTPPSNFPHLSPLQGKLVTHIQQTQNPTLRTNFTQLSRILGCSYGGMRTCLHRLANLGYIKIHHCSARGKQDQLVISATVDANGQPLPE